jgi:hypothetical protein
MPGVQNRTPASIAPVAHLDRDPKRMAAAVIAISARIESMCRSRGGCAYLFVRDGWCYVVHCDSPRAIRWSRRHRSEWIGCYDARVDDTMLLDDLMAAIGVR